MTLRNDDGVISFEHRAAPILAISGGPDVTPTRAEFAALWRACLRRRVRCIRVGPRPTGIDAAVQAWVEAMPVGLERGERRWVFEQWDAPVDSMIRGDRCRANSIFAVGGTIVTGPANVVVVWPGADPLAWSAATEVSARVVEIGELD